jgi:hypothetical protein
MRIRVVSVGGRRPTKACVTFAISSLFLNSPSTIMTSPFSSTSVHLSRGSNAALAACVRLALNILPGPCPGKSSGLNLAALDGCLDTNHDAWLPNILSCQDGLHSTLGVWWSSDAYRRLAASTCASLTVAVRRGFRRNLGRIASTFMIPAWRSALLRFFDVDKCRFDGCFVLPAAARKGQRNIPLADVQPAP